MKHKMIRAFSCSMTVLLAVSTLLPTTVIVDAQTTSVTVSTAKELAEVITDTSSGDTINIVLANDINLGQDTTIKLKIKKGVSVSIANKANKDVIVRRYPLDSEGVYSKFDIEGSLTLKESEGGSLTFDANEQEFKENPQFAVYGDGSSLTINGGIYTGHTSYYGMIYAADEAVLTINHGNFEGNTNNGTCQGGVIWAANCNVTINNGIFVDNVAGLSGGAVYYKGKTKSQSLDINGGTFKNNSANGEFSGGAIYLDCNTGNECTAMIENATFDSNTGKGLGGAIYITNGCIVTMDNIYGIQNSATTEGGAIWNCPTGSGDYYNLEGLYLANNNCDGKGSDFYSKTKSEDAKSIYLSEYAFTGNPFNWIYDTKNDKQGQLASLNYYQNSKEEISLTSRLKEDASIKTMDNITVMTNNTAKSGGAIANNGFLSVGKKGDFPKKEAVTVSVVWNVRYESKEDESIYTNISHAKSATVILMKDGQEFGKPIELSDSNQWTYSWNGLETGHKWEVKELNISAGYEVSYSSENGSNWTITNTLLTYKPRTERRKITATVTTTATTTATNKTLNATTSTNNNMIIGNTTKIKTLNATDSNKKTKATAVAKTGDTKKLLFFMVSMGFSLLGIGLALVKEKQTANN